MSIAMPMLALVASSGCYLSYGVDDVDAAARDASVRDAAAPDALPLLDAGRDAAPDAGLVCPVVRADYVCLDHFAAQPGRPFSLPLSYATCGCLNQAECSVAVDPASQTLRLTTTLCTSSALCFACDTPTTSCEVPALAEGNWTVTVNGSAAFMLPVRAESDDVPAPACVDFAEPISCDGDLSLPGSPTTTLVACVGQTPGSPATYTIEATDPCGGCTSESTCTVRLEPRYTDDLPPGGEVFVEVNQYYDSCVDCLPTCERTTRVCAIPPLVSGDFYRVHIEGVSPFTFVAGSGERTCAGARSPDAP